MAFRRHSLRKGRSSGLMVLIVRRSVTGILRCALPASKPALQHVIAKSSPLSWSATVMAAKSQAMGPSGASAARFPMGVRGAAGPPSAESGVSRGLRSGGLDRADHLSRVVRDDKQWIAQSSHAHVLEGREGSGILLRPWRHREQHLCAGVGEAAGGDPRPAPLAVWVRSATPSAKRGTILGSPRSRVANSRWSARSGSVGSETALRDDKSRPPRRGTRPRRRANHGPRARPPAPPVPPCGSSGGRGSPIGTTRRAPPPMAPRGRPGPRPPLSSPPTRGCGSPAGLAAALVVVAARAPPGIAPRAHSLRSKASPAPTVRLAHRAGRDALGPVGPRFAGRIGGRGSR